MPAEREASHEDLVAEDLTQIADMLRTGQKGCRSEKVSFKWLEAILDVAATDLQALAHGVGQPGRPRPPGIWRSAEYPPAIAGDERFSISVLGVIDDPALRLNGDEPFVDVVACWPTQRRWTVTHVTRADGASVAEDFETNVVAWRPLPSLPPRGTVWR